MLLMSSLALIGKMQKQIELLDREQYDQNKEIMDLMKFKSETTQMLLQHIEIIKYLVEKDDIIGKKVTFYKGPMGEA